MTSSTIRAPGYGATMRDETQPLGATPGDDLSGLLAAHLTTRAERNVAETESIGRAYDKYIFRARRKKRGSEWLTDGFLRMTHREMFGSIWNWAGVYRTTQLNLGVEPYHIREQIQAAAFPTGQLFAVAGQAKKEIQFGDAAHRRNSNSVDVLHGQSLRLEAVSD